jgi:hypothetical protein
VHLVHFLLWVPDIDHSFFLQLLLLLFINHILVLVHTLLWDLFELPETFPLVSFYPFMAVKNRVCSWETALNCLNCLLLVVFHGFELPWFFDIIQVLVLDDLSLLLLLLVIDVLDQLRVLKILIVDSLFKRILLLFLNICHLHLFLLLSFKMLPPLSLCLGLILLHLVPKGYFLVHSHPLLLLQLFSLALLHVFSGHLVFIFLAQSKGRLLKVLLLL